MALNFPGPYEVRINYTVSSRPHVAKLNCFVVGAPDYVEDWASEYFLNKGGTSTQMDTAMDTWVALMGDLLNSGVATIDFAELWKYEPASFVSSYAGAYDISVAATAAFSLQPYTQNIFSFRTLEGNNMSIQLMEGVRVPTSRVTYASMNEQEQALVDHCLSNDMVWQARDTSFPLAFRHLLCGQNEALWKKVFR